MYKMFKYRIYPNKKQLRKLDEALSECRWLYNHFVEQRKIAYEQQGKILSRYDQINTLVRLKTEHPTLKNAHAQVLQNVAARVDIAFKDFYHRCDLGENPGFPRFRGVNRYHSFTFPQDGFKIMKDGRLRISKIGTIKMVYHRPVKGFIKTCSISRSSTGKWYVCFSCECEPEPLASSPEDIGIDVGVKTFVTFSNGEAIENPHFFQDEKKALAKARRNLSKTEEGTKERSKRYKVVARIHERIKFRRDNFTHQISRQIVNRFEFIYVEDLDIKRMLHKNHYLAKSIIDAAWSRFFIRLSSKAEEAGRTVVKVNPAYTSQDCSRCLHRQEMPLSKRTYHCPCCFLSIDRDLNAAINIYALGLQSLGFFPESPRSKIWRIITAQTG